MITLDLTPEVEARLAEDAQARGIDLPTYAARVLEDAAARAIDVRRKRSSANFEAFMQAMADGSDKLPLIPTENFSRESFYKNRG